MTRVSFRRRNAVVFIVGVAFYASWKEGIHHSHHHKTRCAVEAFFPTISHKSRPFSRNPKAGPTLQLSSSPSLPPRGSAANPNGKKKVAVVGAGGYLGATIFGFLQRASSLPHTGLGGKFSASPRAICATAVSSKALNKVLGLCFRLAFAGENMMRLTNLTSATEIARRLEGMDAVIFATRNDLERVKVTLNTYETTPNQETFEVYLDQCRFGAADPLDKHQAERDAFQQNYLETMLEACHLAQVQHMVVIETPQTDAALQQQVSQRLPASGIPFTYIKMGTKEWESTKSFSFEDGIRCQDLIIRSSPTETKTRWASDNNNKNQSGTKMAREDIAAIAVQSLLSLPWETSRCLTVEQGTESTSSDNNQQEVPLKKRRERPKRFDMEWCVNSQVIAEKLSTLS